MPDEHRIHLHLYGIRNCDTVRATLRWLETRNVPVTFHDFRKDGLEKAMAERWIATLGADVVINRRGTTWRKLPDDRKDLASDADAVALILEFPAMIKRPVIDRDGALHVGFKDDAIAFIGGVNS